MAHFSDNPAGTNQGALPAPEGLGTINVATKKWRPTQPLVLALVVVVSASALYAMRSIGVKHAIAFDGGPEFDFDAAKDAAFQAQYDRVMGELSSVNNPLDIALVDFGKSPFALPVVEQVAMDAPRSVLPVPSLGPTPEQRAALEAARRREFITNEAGNIIVQSVMDGRVPLARINDEIYRMGDTVNEVFKIVGIEGRSVTLEAEGQRFTLNMATPGDDPTKSPKKRK
jgi:hypothetical protein